MISSRSTGDTKDAMENEHDCDVQNRFIRGYSLGVLMAAEVMEAGHFQIWEYSVCVYGNNRKFADKGMTDN